MVKTLCNGDLEYKWRSSSLHTHTQDRLLTASDIRKVVSMVCSSI